MNNNYFNHFLIMNHRLAYVSKRIFTTLILAVTLLSAYGVNKTASVSGPWSSTTTWGGNPIPTSIDNARINGGVTVTVDISTAVCVNLNLGLTAGVAGLTFNSGSQITSSGTISIGSTGTANIDMTSGGTLISTGGTITVNNGGTFTPGTGTLSIGATVTLPASYFTNLNNLTLTAGTTTLGATTVVNGNFTMSGGSFVQNTGATTFGLTIGGNFNLSGGSYDFSSGSGQSTVTLNGNFSQTGASGTITTSGTANDGIIVFNKTGTQTYSVATPGNFAWVQYTIASASTVQLLTNMTAYGSTSFPTTVTVNGTLDASTFTVNNAGASDGTFTLASTGTLITKNTGGLVNSTTGTVSTTFATARTFNAAAQYVFNGTSAQVTSTAMPAVLTSGGSVTINNSAGVTLSQATAFGTGTTLFLTSGAFTNAALLSMNNGSTINRDLGTVVSVPTFAATVNVTYSGTTAVTTANELPTGASNLGALTINKSGGVTLLASANPTVNGTLTFTSGNLTVAANTLTLNNAITTTSGGIIGSSSISNLTVASTGALTGTLALSGSFGIFNWTRATGGTLSGSFNVAGNFTNSAGSNIDFTTNTITVTFNGTSGTQTLAGNSTFYNLTLNNSGATSDFGSATTTIANALTASAGTMSAGTSTVIFTGSAGSMAGGNAKNFNNLQFNSGAVITTSGSGNIFVKGSYTNNGTSFTQLSTQTFTFNGAAAQSLTGTGTSGFGSMQLSTSGTVVNSGSHGFSVTGASFDAASGTTFNGGTNTVTFAGGATTTVLGSGTGAFNFNAITINNGSTLSDATNNKNYNVAGVWANNGTYTTGTETVTLNGASGQTLGGTAATTFKNLTISDASNITLNTSENVSNLLNFTNGKIITGANTLSLTSASIVAITGAGAGKYINGNLKITIPAGTPSVKFEIGDASNYTPAQVDFSSVSVGGTLTAKTTSGDHPNIAASTINSAKDVNRYWTFTNTGITFTNYNITLTFINSGDLDGTANTAAFSIQRYNGSSWSATTTGTLTSTSTKATGIDAFSDFAVGEACSNLDQSAGSAQNVCGTSAVLAAGTAPSGATGTWSPTSGLSYAPNVNSPTATVSGLTASGGGTLTTLSWTITQANCSRPSTVGITAISIPSPPAGTVAQPFCSATSPTVANLTATGTAIKWYAASSGGSALLSTVALTNGTHYYASQTVNTCESTSRFDVTVTVNTTPSAPTGTAAQPFCSAASPTVANLTATGSNIQWYAASSGGSALSGATALVNGTHYYASQTTNNCESTTRFDVTATVNTTPSAPTGTAAQPFCSAASPTVANLTATGSNIQWYAASSGGSALSGATALVNGTHYYASQTTNNCESTTRFDVTATVNTTPSAPTGTAAQPFCSAASPTVANLTATGSNIQWYAASSGGSALSGATALVNGTHYYASQTTNNCESTSRFDVTVTVNTTPSAPTGTAAQPFCSAASPTVANLTATGSNIQWYAASSGGSALSGATALVNGTHYYASQTTNNCESTTRFDVTATVNTTPSAPTGTAAQPFCSAASPTVADLSATGSSILWYDASSGGSLVSNGTALVNGTHYYASQTTNGCESTTRLDVTATVNTNPSAPTGIASQSFCSAASPTVADLSATGSSILWYDASSGGSLVSNGTVLVNGTHYYASQTTNGCESTTRLDVTATVNTNPSAPTGIASQSFCSAASPTVADLSATGSSILWYDASSGGSLVSNGTALVNGTHYYASQTTNGCESTTRLDVTATVNTNPSAPTGIASQSFCSAASPTVADLSATGSSILWYDASSGGSLVSNGTVLVNGTHYYASQTTNGCESTTRLDVTATVNTNPSAPTGIASQSFCSAASPTVADLSATGSSILWYDASSGGSLVSNGTALVNGTHYYASQTTNGCESTTRLDVTATVNPTPFSNAGNTISTCYNAGAVNITAGSSAANNSGITWSTPNGTGSFTNSNSLTTATYSPSPADITAGSVTITLTANGNLPCGNAASNKILTIISAPPNNIISSISGTLEACNNQVFQMTANSAGGPGISYSWSTGASPSVVRFSNLQTGPFVTGPFITTGVTVWAQFISASGSGYSVCASAVNSCGSSLNRCQFVRGIVSVPGTITPAAGIVACPNDIKNYSCGVSGGASIYSWTLNGSATPITSGQGSQNVSVTFPPGFISGNLCVTAALSCGTSSTSASRCMSISKNPTMPAIITGSSAVCPLASGVSFSVPPVTGASGYNWTIPSGATIASGVNTPSITVNFPTPYNGAPSVCVSAISPCGISSPRCKTVNSGIPNQPASITGPGTNLCGSQVQYAVVNPSGLSYTWTQPSGTTITSGQGSSTILLSVSNTFNSGYLSVVANSALCPPATSIARTSGTIFGKPNTPGIISAFPSLWCSGDYPNFFVASVVPPVTNNWTVTNGSITLGQGSNNIEVLWGTNAPGTVTVNASNGCGTSSGYRSQSFTTNNCREQESEFNVQNSKFNAYPNPTRDLVTVSIYVKEQEQFNIQFRDISGRILFSEIYEGAEGMNVYDLNLKNFAKGIYVLEIQSVGNSWKTKVVIE